MTTKPESLDNSPYNSFCYLRWPIDHWNDQLWTRITNVNADRSNQYIHRPIDTHQIFCGKKIYTKYDVKYDTCNLPNYSTETDLFRMNVSNNRDTADYNATPHCKNRFPTVNRKLTLNEDSEKNFDVREVTRPLYQTRDDRNKWMLKNQSI